jgi:DNA modification methylase
MQLSFPLNLPEENTFYAIFREKVVHLLMEDLDFHEQESRYASHNFHSFPAKFPPQLPQKFIAALTKPNEVVLDPMSGSGTTVLEAALAGRQGIGLDIDPLALLIAKVKAAPLNPELVNHIGQQILERARQEVVISNGALHAQLNERWDTHTKTFIDYWFTKEVQIELLALITQINRIPNPELKAFFKLVFSAIVITKSGGVSLALDLGHTRPHKAKVVLTKDGQVFAGNGDNISRRSSFTTKILRSPIDEFEKRLKNNLKGLRGPFTKVHLPYIAFGNAQNMPLQNNSVDLIVTSPPYASNAIDYMRAHKFSLAWMGFPIDQLSEKRKEYIGGETTTDFSFERLPRFTEGIVSDVSSKDLKKGRILHRYYSEMTRVLSEMYRVLKPCRAAIVVVGSSVMRGIDTQTQNCLADIGKKSGFLIPAIGIRNLDRDRRMMPVGHDINEGSQIQQRMHEEYVIGLIKP